jgi:hypothetical protein
MRRRLFKSAWGELMREGGITCDHLVECPRSFSLPFSQHFQTPQMKKSLENEFSRISSLKIRQQKFFNREQFAYRKKI